MVIAILLLTQEGKNIYKIESVCQINDFNIEASIKEENRRNVIIARSTATQQKLHHPFTRQKLHNPSTLRKVFRRSRYNAVLSSEEHNRPIRMRHLRQTKTSRQLPQMPQSSKTKTEPTNTLKITKQKPQNRSQADGQLRTCGNCEGPYKGGAHTRASADEHTHSSHGGTCPACVDLFTQMVPRHTRCENVCNFQN
ncbi:hypothetical protein EVAR_99277_1 [Eumeta japonica]|uniref:Uncharacterized protein n=1 Tax=Eumeta variegata TaxID=151549 RepID=A0A4C1Z913_EUMVA|nr:hypothetical protein EVAR_99277_1 [Eumeta japonica]